MKKLVALLVTLAFVAGIASIAFAASPAEIRAYISTLQSKLAVATKNKNKARISTLKALINAERKRLAEAEATVTPAPRMVVPPPPPPPAPKKVIAPVAPPSLFGWGINAAGSLGYVMNKSVIAGRVDAILPDPLGLGPIVGLSADSVKYRVGLGGISGDDTESRSLKGIPLFVDGLIMIPASVLGGIESYLGGGLNYLVYRSGAASGSLGGEIYYGIQGDIGVGGKSFAELGYTILRTADTKTPRSSKGLSLAIGHSLLL